MFEKLSKIFSRNDLIYFFYSILFYEIFFKLTRRYYYFFENTLDYYFSFFSENYFYSSYSFLVLSILISLFSILISKTLSINHFLSNLLSFICILSCWCFYTLNLCKHNKHYLVHFGVCSKTGTEFFNILLLR